MLTNLVASFPRGAGGLSVAQVDSLLGVLRDERMAQGRTGFGRAQDVVTEIRSGAVQWLAAEEVGESLYEHLFTLAVVANRVLRWNFELEGITPQLQATRYASEGREHYSWHMDWGAGRTRFRKVTVVVHLSDGAEYEGGALQLSNGSVPVEAVQQAGTCTVFPSFLLHRVTPVTAGTRLGLVAWALGPSFR
jgi:PKHD-type hydroxylase